MENQYSDAIDSITNIEPSQWWFCESRLAILLGFTFFNDDGHIPAEAGTIFPNRLKLSKFITDLQKGKAQMNTVESLGVLVGKKSRKRQRQPQQLSHLMSGLLAAFQLQPSNTRVNEQAHGFAEVEARCQCCM